MKDEPIKFTRDMEIGLPAIDAQHREYFKRLNDLMRKCREGVDFDDISAALTFFQNYALEHFDSEEYLMREKKFPLFDDQKRFHQYFCRTLDDLTTALKSDGGFCETNIVDLRQLTFDWFVDHIQVHDRKIADHIKAML